MDIKTCQFQKLGQPLLVRKALAANRIINTLRNLCTNENLKKYTCIFQRLIINGKPWYWFESSFEMNSMFT